MIETLHQPNGSSEKYTDLISLVEARTLVLPMIDHYDEAATDAFNPTFQVVDMHTRSVTLFSRDPGPCGIFAPKGSHTTFQSGDQEPEDDEDFGKLLRTIKAEVTLNPKLATQNVHFFMSESGRMAARIAKLSASRPGSTRS